MRHPLAFHFYRLPLSLRDPPRDLHSFPTRRSSDLGEVEFEGRRYLITRGSLDFADANRIQPFFDIEAETRVRATGQTYQRSEEHTSELQSQSNLVCRLLLEKKKEKNTTNPMRHGIH